MKEPHDTNRKSLKPEFEGQKARGMKYNWSAMIDREVTNGAMVEAYTFALADEAILDEMIEKISTLPSAAAVEEEQMWTVVANKKGKKNNRRKIPVMATRASTRVARDGVPILEKAAKRAREKNLIQGMSQPNPFLILNHEPNENLITVMKDIGLTSDNFDTQLDIFRTKELARASIVKANCRARFSRR
jgi:hypothetical protein